MLTFIYGTRPESIKLFPLVREAKRRKLAFRVICTGQHTSLLSGTGLRPDVNLNIQGTNSPLEYVKTCTDTLLHVKAGGTIIVQGDTASAVAGARLAKAKNLRLVHVEAGLRSHDLTDPWPEEGFRIEIDQLSDIRCCPTRVNVNNLSREGLSGTVTGNTITDSLRLQKVQRQPSEAQTLLVTLHRRESFGEPLKNIISGLSRFATENPDWIVFWPTHPNPEVQKALQTTLPSNVLTRSPLPYQPFLKLLSQMHLVLTDSGGLTEETTTLGLPTVIARNHTERPEALGLATLAGTQTDAIYSALSSHRPEPIRNPVFGNGHASEAILDLLR